MIIILLLHIYVHTTYNKNKNIAKNKHINSLIHNCIIKKENILLLVDRISIFI